jgi:molybdate transport system ATP-binding protein
MKMCKVMAATPDLRLADPVDWTIREGEQWAIVGANGAGKTLLAEMLQGRIRLLYGEIVWEQSVTGTVRCISFKDIYSLTDCRNAFYQQRWHTSETDDMPTAEGMLPENGELTSSDRELLHRLGVQPLLSKKIACLSGGELRRFLIVRALLDHPKLLVLDNPFIGLDAEGRATLFELLQEMTAVYGLQTVLLLPSIEEIPDMVTHVLPVCERRCLPPLLRKVFLEDEDLHRKLFPARSSFRIPEKQSAGTHEITLRMEKVTVKYGNRTILDGVDWEVRNREKWALLGANGSGKSTLLSLIYADHPQAYANRLYLFDRRRGSGESIWEIKERIGFVSPEIHLYYNENVPGWKIVGSGYFDSIGLFRKCNSQQEAGAKEWMETFGIGDLKERLFLTLSSGEQRMLLIARAFVKDPDLLILDEPLHGLDTGNKHRVTDIIEDFCRRNGKTLIYVTHYPEELPPCIHKSLRLD